MKRFPSGIIVPAVLLGLLTGCTAARIQARPPLEQQGVVYLYLEALPVAAAKLSFTLERIAAVSETGEEVPLSLRLDELSVRTVSRERLLAQGELPPGRYGGVALKVKKASLSDAKDNAAIQWTEETVRFDVRFEVVRKKANVLSLRFLFNESLVGGVLFPPRFRIVPAPKPPRGVLGYVVNRGSNTVTVFDRMSGRVSDVIPTGAAPSAMAVDSILRNKGYVAVSGEDAVEVVDLLQGEVIDRIRLTMGDRPVELALTPDGNTLFTVNTGSSTVSVIDTASRDERVRLTLSNGPSSITLDPAGRRAYVFNTGGTGISVIDVASRMVAATIATESAPLRGQFNRQGDRLYVIHEWSPYLLAIDPFTLSPVRRQHVGMGYQALSVDPSFNRIYIARRGAPDVEVLDPYTLVATRYLEAGGDVSFTAVDGQEKSLLMLIPGKATLRIVDLIRGDGRAEVDVGEEPCWVAVTGER